MLFETMMNDLRQAVSVVNHATKFGAPKDYRFHGLVYVQAADDSISLATHCGYASWVAHCDAKVDAPGACIVSIEALNRLLVASKDNTVRGSYVDMDRLQLAIGRGRYTLPTTAGVSVEEFPDPIECGAGARPITLKSSDLIKLLVKPQFSVCDAPSQLQMGGIFLHMSRANFNDYAPSERLAATATDGKRLYWASIPYPEKLPPLPNSSDNEKGLVITCETATEIAAIAKLATETLIEIDTNTIVASSSRIIFASKVMDVLFPAYTKLWRPNSLHIAEFDRADFLALLKRMGAVDTKGTVRLQWNGADLVKADFLRSTAEASDELAASCGGAGNFAAPLWQMIEICEHLTGSRMRISLRKPTEPVIIQDSEDSDVLIMQAPSF